MYVKLNMYGCTHVRDGTDVPVFADTCTRANDASNCTAVCSTWSALFPSPMTRENSLCRALMCPPVVSPHRALLIVSTSHARVSA